MPLIYIYDNGRVKEFPSLALDFPIETKPHKHQWSPGVSDSSQKGRVSRFDQNVLYNLHFIGHFPYISPLKFFSVFQEYVLISLKSWQFDRHCSLSYNIFVPLISLINIVKTYQSQWVHAVYITKEIVKILSTYT